MVSKSVTKSSHEISTLVELLRYRALREAHKQAYTFLVDGETEEMQLTYSELDQQARAIAVRLQHMGAAGERALLLYPPGLDFVAAFFGCIYAGCIAVPAYPPRLNRHVPRLQAIIDDARATVALTSSQVLSKIEHRLNHTPGLATLRWLATDSISGDDAEAWHDLLVKGNDLAYLQYTSGSTSTPKGVMVSHENVLYTMKDIDSSWVHSSDSRLVTWLPHFHDMGLIYGVLQPIYNGIPCTMMSPTAFVQHPERWLKAISRFKATHSGAPNFAYDLCAHKVTPEQRAGLDLSSWRVALNGAEPVRKETLERFHQTFESCGFQWDAFCPGYGLAEATLKVAAVRKVTAPAFRRVRTAELEQNRAVTAIMAGEDAQTLVSCGQTMLDTRVVIVRPDSLSQAAAGEVGEIWVSGSCVAQGYWKRPDETKATFEAHLADTGEGPFLRTGDLGFLKSDQLFVTGRLKDLIIVRGRNLYPQDIELTTEESHPALRPGCGAAFSVEVNGQEQLVIVQEVKRQYRNIAVEEVARAIRGAVAEIYELQVYAVVLLKTGAVLKTSSGKIQRQACRARFLEDDLNSIGSSFLENAAGQPAYDDAYLAPRSSVEKAMVELWAEVLGVEQVGLYDNFFELGGHSLSATQLISRVNETFQVEVPLGTLFEAPTVASLSERVAAAGPLVRTEHVTPISPVPRSEKLQLSFSQERMWFLHQLQPDSIAYHMPFSIRLTGALNVVTLEQSFNELIQRHESLRTTFALAAGQPIQVIAPVLTLTIPLIDLQQIPQEMREGQARARVVQEIRRSFDLVKGPLLRVKLFQLDKEEYLLLIVMHHIISDAWSFSVLWQEIAALYGAVTRGKPDLLPALTSQYVDFAHWQRQWLQGETLQDQLAYWKKQLAGAPTILELPADRPRPAVQSFHGAVQYLSLPGSLLEALKILGYGEGATLSMTLLAAFKALLYHYTGQSDILVGMPIANRHWLAVEGLIGTFVNTLVVRTNLADNPTFKELLAQVRQVSLSAFAHQDLPFEQLVEELQPDRDLSHNPIIQVLVSVANPPMPVVQFPDLDWDIFEVDRGAAQFDLALFMIDTNQIQKLWLEYNTDLFDHATISRMMSHLRTLLEGIVSTGLEQRLADLPLLSEAERHQLLAGWNDTGLDRPETLSVHTLFEAQVERTPDSVAVIFEERELTYRELNQRANQLARHLRTLSVGPEVCVGICMERSPEMLVGLLAILKAGGTFLPMDPAYPEQRLAFMLEDSGAPVLLTQQRLLNMLPQHSAVEICLDEEAGSLTRFSEANLNLEISPESLAYSIYTSGSTGIPKGVEIPHRALVNFLNAMRQQPGLAAQDHLLAVTTLSFDIAMLELFLPIISGARVQVVSRELAADGTGLIKELSRSGATVMQATPATWQLLLDAGWQEESRLRMLCGGEALPRNLAGHLLNRGASLWNMYGPTETTIWSVVHQVEPGDRAVSIGRPIANTQIYILDSHLRPVPIGVPGELHIGGAGLARGYHNRPNITAEKFIPNPFSTEPGDRLYKTGDLARYLPDGKIDFLGRIDHQVKLRGFRIELGEIEAVLRQHPALQEVVVVVREYTAADKRLVAYMVLNKDDEAPPVGDLRRLIREKLPEYMMPAAFVRLELFPLTPNGKINRLALPAPEVTRPDLEKAYIPAETFIEERLVEIWSQILGIDQVGVRDNFFELGGHSLLITQIIARIYDDFQVELSLLSFFETPTIADLALIIEDSLIREIDTLSEGQAQQLINSVG